MRPTFFKSAKDFRAWLEKHHAKDELVLGFFKVSSGKGGITHKEALDQALCYGWIDGVGKSRSADSYTIRFTPRRPGSHWSRINIRRAHELTAAGLMHAVGLAAFERRDEGKTINYSYELRAAKLTPAFEKRFKANKAAWTFFISQPPSYQRHAKFFVMSAKREETRARRLERLIADSAAGRRIGILETRKPSNPKSPESTSP
jgi:uncharacterized protein YdeI (YjbR/CyaY-like superfamily)